MMDASNAKTSWSFPLQEMMVGSLRTPVGGLIARPWFDQVALQVLAKWFFPLSRLWAAARAADGSIERYCAEAPMEPAPWLRSMLEPRLKRFETARNGVVDMEDLWEEAFWGRDTPSDETLKEIEHARLFRRNGYNALRRIFIPLKLRGAVTPIQWNTPTPSEVEAIYGRFADDPEAAFRPPEIMPEIVKSRVIETESRRDYWLRFTSPSARMNDQTIARVYEPKGVENPPTIILGHGICVEFDHWRGLTDEAQALAEMGNRVIRPEAPWHGRRVPPGRYGGEQFVATAPLGALDLFTSAVQEWAVLMHWCRQTTTGPGRHRRHQPGRDDGAARGRQIALLAATAASRRAPADHPLRPHRGCGRQGLSGARLGHRRTHRGGRLDRGPDRPVCSADRSDRAARDAAGDDRVGARQPR